VTALKRLTEPGLAIEQGDGGGWRTRSHLLQVHTFNATNDARRFTVLPTLEVVATDESLGAAERIVLQSYVGQVSDVACDDAALAALIATTRALAGDRHIVVPVKSERAFRRALRELGYPVPGPSKLRDAA
jgi:hypothetical protein